MKAWSTIGAAFILTLAACAMVYAAATAERPSLVKTYLGNLDNGDADLADNTTIQTPPTDRLAARWMIFNHNYAGAPHCSPSRAMLMWGWDAAHASTLDTAGRGNVGIP